MCLSNIGTGTECGFQILVPEHIERGNSSLKISKRVSKASPAETTPRIKESYPLIIHFTADIVLLSSLANRQEPNLIIAAQRKSLADTLRRV